MKRFWGRICGFVSEHDLFFRLFLILFGCIILPVSIACLAFNWQAENLVRTQTERTNSAYLTSLSTQLESALNAQRMQMLDYSVKETLTGSFRSNKFTKDATTLLNNALSSNENLEAVFVLDPGTNRIASNIGCFDAEIYFSKYCRFPGYSFEELYGTLCENRAFSFIGALDYTRYSLVKNRQDSRALLLLYTYFPEQSYGTNRVMGFVLSPSLTEALLDDRFLERQGDICIFDAAGAPVCSTFAQTDNLPLFDDSEVHNCRIGDADYQVQSLSGAYGLRYISVIPTSEYYSGLQPIRSFTLLLILILLVLIVLISAIFSSRISRPIIRLANSFSEPPIDDPRSAAIESTAVYRSIRSNINEIRASNEKLSTLMKSGQEQLRSNILLDILRGRPQDEALLSYQLAELGAQFPHKYYTLVLLSFDFYKRAYLDYTPVELAHMQDGICKLTAAWAYPFEQKIEYMECLPRTFAFIVNMDELNLTALHRELTQILRLADIENDQLRLIFVTTSFVNRLEELPELYQSAKNALRYRVLNRQSQLIQSMHLPSAGEYPSFLTDENKNYITNYITSGNADAAKSYIVALIEQSAENGIPYEHLITSFSSILSLIAQILTARSIPFFPLFDADPFAELSSLNNLDEIGDFFRSVCTKATAALLERQQQESDILRRSLDYIARNYHNRISLDDVSAYVGYSPKYFSRYFKDQTGITFVNYLNRLRIQAAKELLADPNIVIKDVAARVGFENINTFFRVFKQFEGVTPGQYRAAHAPTQEDEQS